MRNQENNNHLRIAEIGIRAMRAVMVRNSVLSHLRAHTSSTYTSPPLAMNFSLISAMPRSFSASFAA